MRNPHLAIHASLVLFWLSASPLIAQYAGYPARESAPFHYGGPMRADNYNGADNYSQSLESRIASLEDHLHRGQPRTDYAENGGCLPTCCESLTSGRASGFFLGGGLIFARPHFKESFEFSQTNLLNGQQTLIPFDFDYEATPVAWFGFRNAQGLGVKMNYWQFDASGQSRFNTSDGINIYGAHAITIIFPANIFAALPGESLATQNSLRTQILNVIGTKDLQIDDIQISGGVGLRYVNLEQSLSAQVFSGSIPIRLLDWRREFEGLGPAASFDAIKPLGCTPFSVFAQAGGALLYGTKNLSRTVLGDQSPQPASPFLNLQGADEVVGVGELGLGLQWQAYLATGSQFTVRGSYQGSLWAEAGAPTLGFLGFEGFGITAELTR